MRTKSLQLLLFALSVLLLPSHSATVVNNKETLNTYSDNRKNIMSLLGFFKPKKEKTVLEENPDLMQQKVLFDLLSGMCDDGCDTDELPQSAGRFGYDITNPIPTHTVQGSTCYLEKLQTYDGEKIKYKRLGSCSSDISSHPIDLYKISHPNGEKLGEIYLSPYHKRNSEKPPTGFRLA